jgi:glycosyltransferase involved in cell wall biosynthesis
MIPTFNCASYLRQTLESVLAQAPGPEQMQIEVVDDCSTKDNPETVVREVGKGRVAFYRKPKNEGATANFNTCIERSRGQLVHILHGDDYVLPGFYQKLESLAQAYRGVGFIASRAFFIDEKGVITSVSDRLRELESGSRLVEAFYYRNPIQCASIVVRRSFYERHGGFLPGLIHTADCEMWARAISREGGVVSSEVLACYRTFAANDTGRLARAAENLCDLERLHRIFAARHPAFDRRRSVQEICGRAVDQAVFFEEKGDREAARANWDYWKKNAPLTLRLRRFLRTLARKLK